MQVLDSILNGLRFRGPHYFSAAFAEPWSVRVPRHRHTARIHLAVRGGCWIGTAESAFERLEPGDCAIITDGREHFLRDEPQREPLADHDLPAPDGETNGFSPYASNDDASIELFCGYVSFDDAAARPLSTLLPPMLVSKAGASDLPRLLHPAIKLAQDGGIAFGREIILRRLSEILFIEAISRWIAEQPPRSGLFAALANPGLKSALEAIHGEPQRNWTVRELASIAGRSRTTFAEQFRLLLGLGPIEYLIAWRMTVARRLLEETDLSIGRVAETVGYSSVAALTRAFARVHGASPGNYRRLNT